MEELKSSKEAKPDDSSMLDIKKQDLNKCLQGLLHESVKWPKYLVEFKDLLIKLE